jgi:hypothetical protein
VKRWPQPTHSLRRRMASLLSVSRESITLLSGNPQYGQFTAPHFLSITADRAGPHQRTRGWILLSGSSVDAQYVVYWGILPPYISLPQVP